MTNGLFLEGIFNIIDPVLGWTLYMWSWIALLILIAVAWAGMYYRGWKPLAPLHGLFYALKNSSTVAFIFDSTLVGELVSERDAKCIFNYATEYDYEIEIPETRIPGLQRLVTWFYTKTFYYPTHFLKHITLPQAIIYKIGGVNKDVEIARLLEGGEWERSASVVCAGVPTDIVIDMDNWTIKTSRQHAAIVRTARAWNELNPTDQIHSYRKFGKYLQKGEFKCPDELKKSVQVPWQRIDAGFPIKIDENEWAGWKRQKANQLASEEEGSVWKLAIYLGLGGLGFDILILIARLVVAIT